MAKKTKEQLEAERRIKMLSDKEVQQMGEDATRLHQLNQQQLIDYKLWLLVQLRNTTMADGSPVDPATIEFLQSEIAQIRIEYVRVEQAVRNDKGEATVSAVWEFPDNLMAFFKNEDFKRTAALEADLKRFQILPEPKAAIQRRINVH